MLTIYAAEIYALIKFLVSFNILGLFLVAMVLLILGLLLKSKVVRVLLALTLVFAASARFTGVFSGPSEGNRTGSESELSTPYSIISIRSVDTGGYMTCDIGEKDDTGRYNEVKMDEPAVHFEAKTVGFTEMFELVPCSDHHYAIRSVANRKYLSGSSVTFEADFVKDEEKIELIRENDQVVLQFTDTGDYIQIGSERLEATTNESEASRFELSVVSENAYSEDEIRILKSSDWFDKDGMGYGYWNIQEELGKGHTYALKDSDKLGYTLLKKDSLNVIGIDNMQCVVGVKEISGKYDVIIAFQGTGGYGTAPFDTLWDAIINLKNDTSKDGKHLGYSKMTQKLIDREKEIKGEVNGNSLALSDLVEYAREGNAHFTLLGHSMGGAMAQIYALYLNQDKGIDQSRITGRTFNTSPALDRDIYGWTDWYNLCVSSDTVSNGLVPGSLRYYGLHRLGITVWLYDDEPDQNIGRGLFFVANIANEKHNMDRKLESLLRKSVVSFEEER